MTIKKLIYWLPSIAWMGIIYFLSGRTGNELNKTFPFITDFNWGHILAYFILATLLYYALYRSVKYKSITWWSLGICLFYGISDEFHQYFVPTRTPDIWDLARDMLGAGTAIFLIQYARKKMQRQTDTPLNNFAGGGEKN